MKLGLTLSGINQTIKNLEQAGIVIQKDFGNELLDKGKQIRDKSKEILERESASRTSKRYWTGALKESIKVNVVRKERDNITGISVGPDMRRAPYAEWIEVGHFVVAGAFGTKMGNWWEGYHYMEGAYAELAPEIPQKIAKTLNISLTKFARTASKRTRHVKTGKFVGGFGGWN